MSKQEKNLLTVGIICFVGFIILMTTGLILMTKHGNQKSYKNLPEINMVEQDTEEYMLGYWYKSNVSLIFIRQEKISDNYIVYYFKLKESLFLDGYNTYYVKTIYRFRNGKNSSVMHKDWYFEKVLRSHYSEAVEEEDNNENNNS